MDEGGYGVGWCDFTLLGDVGVVSWVAGGLGGVTMNFGVFVDGRGGVKGGVFKAC